MPGPQISRIPSFLVALMVLVTWHVPTARAEAPAVAEQYELGKHALKADKPAEALTHFKAALSQADRSLGSTWQMLLAVALTYQKLDQPAHAAEMFRRFLEVTEAHGDLMTQKWRTRRELVRKDLTELEQALSTTHAVVMVKSTPPGAKVSVDGARAGVDGDALTPTRLWLSPGEHTIALALVGCAPATRALTLKAGQLDSVVADLAAVIAAAPPVPEAPAELVTAPSEEGDGGSIGPWLVFGGAGAAALVGGVMAGLAQSDYDAALEVTGDPEAYTAHRNSYQTNRVVAGALFGLAGAAAVGGIVWWLLDGDDDEMPTAFGVLPTHEGVRGFAAWRF